MSQGLGGPFLRAGPKILPKTPIGRGSSPARHAAGYTGGRESLVYQLPMRKPTTLTRDMMSQVRRMILRQLRRQLERVVQAPQLERRLRELERRRAAAAFGFQEELDLLQNMWMATVMARPAGGRIAPTQIMRLAKQGIRAVGPQSLKRLWQQIARQLPGKELAAPAAGSAGLTLIMPAPAAASSDERGDLLAREGMAFLLRLLNGVPGAPPMVQRLSRRLRRGGLPISFLPPKPLPGLSARPRHAAIDPDSGELIPRLPVKGILRMRIEPPEAARVLAQHMRLGEVPLVFKQPPTPRQETRTSQEKPKESSLQIKSQAEISWGPEEVARIAKAARASIQEDLFDHLPNEQVRQLADQVYRVLEHRLLIERQRRGRR